MLLAAALRETASRRLSLLTLARNCDRTSRWPLIKVKRWQQLSKRQGRATCSTRRLVGIQQAHRQAAGAMQAALTDPPGWKPAPPSPEGHRRVGLRQPVALQQPSRRAAPLARTEEARRHALLQRERAPPPLGPGEGCQPPTQDLREPDDMVPEPHLNSEEPRLTVHPREFVWPPGPGENTACLTEATPDPPRHRMLSSRG